MIDRGKRLEARLWHLIDLTKEHGLGGTRPGGKETIYRTLSTRLRLFLPCLVNFEGGWLCFQFEAQIHYLKRDAFSGEKDGRFGSKTPKSLHNKNSRHRYVRCPRGFYESIPWRRPHGRYTHCHVIVFHHNVHFAVLVVSHQRQRQFCQH